MFTRMPAAAADAGNGGIADVIAAIPESRQRDREEISDKDTDPRSGPLSHQDPDTCRRHAGRLAFRPVTVAVKDSGGLNVTVGM